MTKLYSYFNSLLNYLFFEEPTQIQIEAREQEFHNMVREYVVFLLIFISLYGISYILIYIFRKKREEEVSCVLIKNKSINFFISILFDKDLCK